MSKSRANSAVSRHIRVKTTKHGGDWGHIACDDCGSRSRVMFQKWTENAYKMIYCKPCLLINFPEDCEVVVEPIEVNE